MRLRKMLSLAVVACLVLSVSLAHADRQWTAGGANERWDDNGNWDFGSPPSSATVLHDPPPPPNNFNNSAVNKLDGEDILIEDGINAVAFGLQIGAPKDGTLGGQSASNALNMTGGSLTVQGNFLINVGRSRNADVNHLAQMNVSGGVVNASGITVPEAFNPDNVLGFTSVGINAELNVSGDAVVTTDLLRLGSFDANSTVTLSDNAQVILSDENNGFANGQLWLESFEDLDDPGGSSLLDIRDCAFLRIDGGVNNIQDDQAASLDLIVNDLIPRGYIVANGGADAVIVQRLGDSIFLSAQAGKIPEPTALALAALACTLMVRSRSGR